MDMPEKTNRYAHINYDTLGAWLKSEQGKADFKKSQQKGDQFADSLIKRTTVKETTLKEALSL